MAASARTATSTSSTPTRSPTGSCAASRPSRCSTRSAAAAPPPPSSASRPDGTAGQPAAGDDASAPPDVSITAATELSAAAHDVGEAASFVHLISATHRFDDGAVNRLRGSLDTLGDALFRDAHPRPDDLAAIKSALTAARSATDALGVLGPRNRHADALLKIIGTIEAQAKASAHAPASSSKDLATKVGRTLERLERVRDLSAPYAKVDHAGLAAAIAQTTEWRDALAGPGATSAARRLGTVVPFQHDQVRSADKDLAKVLADPSIADRGHVVAAFVRAMAAATDPATARPVLDWARSERDRQLLRTAEGMLDGAGNDVATLAGAKIDARREQHGLENRIDQLDARLVAGGKVDDLVLRETLVAARDHAFVTAMQAIEVQTLQLADACEAANSSLIAKAANHWHAAIKKLPGELRALARVPHTFRNEYRHRTAGAHPDPDATGGDARAARMAVIATRTEALDAIEPQARAWAADDYLKERLEFAEAELKDSAVRTLIWTLVATVAQVLVGNFAAAAVRNFAQATLVGRTAMSAEMAAGAAAAAGAATDIGLSTSFQKGILGDDASMLSLAGLNIASTAVGHLIESGFRGLTSVEAAGARNARLWERIAVGDERVVAGARLDLLVDVGERGAIFGTTVSAHMLAGAAVDYAARKVAGERLPDNSQMTAEDWLLQGAAMGLGRAIAARLKPLADRSFRPFRDSVLADRAAALVDRANTLGDTGSIEAANKLISDYHALLDLERAGLEKAIADRGRRPSAGQVEDLRANTRAADGLDAIEGRTMGGGDTARCAAGTLRTSSRSPAPSMSSSTARWTGSSSRTRPTRC
jgi:cell division septum initiation protein DivIVA